MTTCYFIRHGEKNYAEKNLKFYHGLGDHMLTLSELGIKQITAAAHDERLKKAELIISSPFGRALHSAAILSKELGLDIRVETDLHEWQPDIVHYGYLSQEEADRSYQALHDHDGNHPEGESPAWESAEQMKQRVYAVLERYRDYHCIIVSCHGTLMEYVLGIPHPSNGQIVRFDF